MSFGCTLLRRQNEARKAIVTKGNVAASVKAPGSGALEIAAPAKLNLGLRIVGRRADGYHEIESLFVPLDLHDELRVSWVDSPGRDSRVQFALDVPDGSAGPPSAVPADASNLAARAGLLFMQASRLQVEVEIRLTKRIPAAAGLGGGSSDAAAVLRALDRFFPDRLPSGEIQRLALGLGADVPYFLDPQNAWITGIGEGIEEVPGVPNFSVLLVNPGRGLSTAEVYSAWDARSPALTRAEAGSTMRALTGLKDDSRTLSERFSNLLVNDLESVAAELCPEVASLRAKLLELGSLAVGMSGSGATVFGVFPDERSARSAMEQADFEAPFWAQVTKAGDPKSCWGVAKW